MGFGVAEVGVEDVEGLGAFTDIGVGGEVVVDGIEFAVAAEDGFELGVVAVGVAVAGRLD